MTNSRRILAAFLAGQIVQVVLQIIAKGMYIEKTIMWTSAAGFLLSAAVFMGMCVVCREFKENQHEQHVRKRGKETA